ncbi:Formin 2 Domain containing protein [Histomonas meleagridis]|uniref:Formin-like 2 Domain containing protein n=1 Tax=Histomonas meleagridis TaxID=135588 RepID=UPI00355A583F|nr:Formin 2 Domain containing protein [Histomonas meleagridis]KAH0806735.1 Formin-like 2 Domain containing protein [Histomonas meleagridis]
MKKKSSKKKKSEAKAFHPFVTKKLPTSRPPDSAIDEMLSAFLDDMDIHGEKRSNFIEQKTTDEKWQMMVFQEQLDLSIPSPKSLLLELKNNLTPENLKNVANNLAKSRLSWGKQFLEEGGHVFLFKIIQQISNKLTSVGEISKGDAAILEGLLECFRSICNTSQGLDKVLDYYKYINIIINCIYPPHLRTFDFVFGICLAYLFGVTDPKKHGITLRIILETFRKLERNHHGWKNITYFVSSKGANLLTLYSFLNGIYLTLVGQHGEEGYPSFRYNWLMNIENAGLIKALKESHNELLQNLATVLEDDVSICKSIFPNTGINPFNDKSLCKIIDTNSNPPYLFRNVQLGLVDLALRHNNIFNIIMTYFFNAINITRYFAISAKDLRRYKKIFVVTADLDSPIKLSIEQSDNNTILSELGSEMFAVENELKRQQMKKIIKKAGKVNIDNLEALFGKQERPSDIDGPTIISEAELRQLQQNLLEMKNQVTELNKKCKSLNDEKDDIIKENNKLKAICNELKEKLNKMKNKEEKSDESTKSKSKSKTKSDSSSSDSISTETEAYESYKSNISSSTTEESGISNITVSDNKEYVMLREAKLQSDTKVEKLLEEIEALKKQNNNDKEFNELQQAKVTAESKIIELNSEIESLKNKEITIKNESENIKKELSEVKQENIISKSKIEELENEIKTLKSKESANKEDNTSTKQEMLTIKENNARLQFKIEELEKLNEEMKTKELNVKEENDKIKQELSLTKQSKASVEQKVNELENEIETLKSKEINIKEESDKMKQELINMKQNKAIAENKIEELENEIQTIKTKDLNIKEEYDKIKQENSILKQNKLVNESKIKELEEEIETLTQKSDSSSSSSSSDNEDELRNEINSLKEVKSSNEAMIQHLKAQIESMKSKKVSDEGSSSSSSSSDNDNDDKIEILATREIELNEIKEAKAKSDLKIVELKNEIESLKNNENDYKSENDKIKQELSQVKQSKTIAESKIEELETEINSLKNKENELKTENDKIKQELSLTKQNKITSDSKIEELENDINNLKNKEIELQSENEKIKQELSNVKQSKASSDSKIEELNSEIESLKSKELSLINDAENIKQELLNVKTSKASAEIKIEELQNEINTLVNQESNYKNDSDNIKQELSQMKQTKALLESKIESLNNEIESLKNKEIQINEENDKIKQDLSSTKQNKLILETKIEQYENEIKSYKEKEQSLDNNKKELESKIKEMENEIETLKNKEHSSSSSSSSSSDDEDDNNNEQKEQIEKLTKEISEKDKIIKSHKDEITKLQGQINTIKKKSSNQPRQSQSNANIEALQKQIEAQKAEIAKLKETLSSSGKSEASAPEAPSSEAEAPPPPPPPPPPPDAPPPPPPGAPPPPPGAPPPPGSGMPSKPNPKPPKPLRNLYWTKIPDSTVKGTLWEKIDDTKAKFDEDKLLELFATAAPKPAPTPSGRAAAEAAPPKPKIVELFDQNRSKAITIMVTRFRRPNEQVATEIKTLSDKLTEDEIQALRNNKPNAEEVQAVVSYDGDKALLGKAEQFVNAISGIQMLDTHIDFLYIRKTFDSQIEDVERPLSFIYNGLNSINTSEKLKDLLALILRIGNICNGGTMRGGAYGFKFDFIDKIREIRTQVPGYLLVNFIAEQFPVNELYNELEPIKKALTVDMDTIRKSYKAMDGMFNTLERSLAQAEKLDNSYVLAKEIKKFIGEKSATVKKQPETFNKIDELYAKLVKEYGEDPDAMQMADFFNVFIKLAEELRKAKEVNEKKKADEEKAKNKMQNPLRRGVINAGDAQRGVLDELMKKLQTGPPQLKKVGGGPPQQRGPPPGPPKPANNDLMAAFAKVRKTG